MLDPVGDDEAGDAKLIHPDVVNYKGLAQATEGAYQRFYLYDLGQGRHRNRLSPGGHHRRKHVYHAGGASELHRTPFLRGRARRPDGSAQFWSCSKVPYGVREQVANALQIPQEKLDFNPGLYRRRFRRQGRFHGSRRRLSFVQEGRPAGQSW